MKILKHERGYFTGAITMALCGVAMLNLAGCSTAKPAVKPQVAAQGEVGAPDNTKGFAKGR